ncbi:MAG: hypothetical protein HQL54_09515 [Magnetococcales bacterium]|nr:hypothetical protein [Magnetococcales bacterium]
MYLEIDKQTDLDAIIESVPDSLWRPFLQLVEAEDKRRKKRVVEDQADEAVETALNGIGMNLDDYLESKVGERMRARKVEKKGTKIPDDVNERFRNLAPYFLINPNAEFGVKMHWRRDHRKKKFPEWLRDDILQVLDETDGHPTDNDLMRIIRKYSE